MNAQQIEPTDDGARTNAGAADECARRLSCLLDGELDDEGCRRILEQLRRDEDACRQWAWLNCVGDALRSADVAAWHSERFVARVSAALQDEPTVLAPVARPGHARVRRWLLSGAGVAAAAAVVIAVGLPSPQPTEPAAAVAGRADETAAVAVARKSIQVDRSPLLERYLAAHRELAEPALMPYSTPYVRTSGTLPQQETR